MPTYLTPGVYVEEVPSANKPIEGVGTSIAAFVGLAPGGPVNTPMRISNWTQFAKIYGDPDDPDNGPFMEGAYLAHSVYGFFQNGGGLCWIVRVGDGRGRRARPRAALPAASDKAVEAFRAEALPGVEAPSRSSSPRSPARRQGRRRRPTSSSSRRPSKEEHEGLTLKKGRTNLATKVNPASKFVKIEEAAGLPETRVRPTGTYTLSPPARAPEKVELDRVRGRRRQALGHGRPGRRRRGHDGLHAGHDDARRQRRRRAACATSRAR